MKKVLTVALVLVAFALSGVAAVSAQEKEMKVTVTAGADDAKPCAKAPNLTDEQKAKLEGMRRECALKGEELRADLAKLRVAMKRAMSADEPKLAEIEAVVKKMSAVREQMQMNRIQCMLEARAILGPEWREHCGSGCGRMRGDGGLGPAWMGMMGDEENLDVTVETADEDAPGGMRVMRLRGDGVDRPGRRMLMPRSPEGCGGAPGACMGEAPHAGCPMAEGRRGAAMRAPRAPMRNLRVERMHAGPGAGCAMMNVPGRVCAGTCATAEKTRKVIVVKKGEAGRECAGTCGSGGARRGNWESRMFRPQGKKTHRCAGDCAGAGEGCKIIVKP